VIQSENSRKKKEKCEKEGRRMSDVNLFPALRGREGPTSIGVRRTGKGVIDTIFYLGAYPESWRDKKSVDKRGDVPGYLWYAVK